MRCRYFSSAHLLGTFLTEYCAPGAQFGKSCSSSFVTTIGMSYLYLRMFVKGLQKIKQFRASLLAVGGWYSVFPEDPHLQ